MSEPNKKLTIEELQYLTRFVSDTDSHVSIKDINICKTKCKDKVCTTICPAEAYIWEGDRMSFGYEGCHECGSCRISCPYDNLNWKYPKGGKGIIFRLA